MLRIKKILRVILLMMLVILALSGIGTPPPRHFFEKKEDTIELAENREGESEKD